MTNESGLSTDDLFRSLILNFQVTAMIGMGKMMNPVAQKIERNLYEAQIAIDMLGMLAEKTKGNLSDEEDRMLQQTLTDLRLNFIAERDKPEPEETSETTELTSEETEDQPSDDAQSKDTDIETESNEK